MIARNTLTALALAYISAGFAVSASGGVYEATVLSDNPVGYWQLNETPPPDSPTRNFKQAVNLGSAGTGAIDGFYDFGLTPGSTYGAVGPRPPALPGMDAGNNAPHLDGTDDIVYVADQNPYDIAGELTIEGWIHPDDLGGQRAILGKYMMQGNQRSYLLLLEEGNPRLVISPDGTFGSAVGDVTAPGPVPTGTWTHVAGTFKPDDFMRLYVNGEQVAEITEGAEGVPSQIFTTGQAVRIGYFGSVPPENFKGFFDGRLDEIALYDRALSAAEIRQHYQSALVPEPATLLIWSLLAGLGIGVGWRRKR